METDYQIPVELRNLFTPAQAFKYRLVPIKKTAVGLNCITDRSIDTPQKRELGILFEHPLSFKKVSSEEFAAFLYRNYRVGKSSDAKTLNSETDLLATILKTARDIGSSDIHLEKYKNNARIRLRLDGKLKVFYHIAPKDYPMMVNKIKVKAQLDISEKRRPQDGRISLEDGSETTDLRISVLPTLYGEKVVLRILSKGIQNLNLNTIGFSKQDLKHYLKAIRATQGMVLISGPTGSGKTTTLYATLNTLNTEQHNIVTIEDPIEYTLNGINQVQLNEAIGLGFPEALRSFLRQDPDIIMIGEIRDEVTAQIAVRAALTGHLVFATIHTNSAWGTLSRLMDMSIPPFLLSETLKISVAQRLVRKLCESCKSKVNDTPSDIGGIKAHWKAMGCEKCHFTGFNGRMALFEVLPIVQEIKAVIGDPKAPTHLKKQGYTSLMDQGIKAVNNGYTSVEEIYPLISF